VRTPPPLLFFGDRSRNYISFPMDLDMDIAWHGMAGMAYVKELKAHRIKY
jgi:hypothetical protein